MQDNMYKIVARGHAHICGKSVPFEYRTFITDKPRATSVPVVLQQVADDGTVLVEKHFTFHLPEDEERNVAISWMRNIYHMDKLITQPNGQRFHWSRCMSAMVISDRS